MDPNAPRPLVRGVAESLFSLFFPSGAPAPSALAHGMSLLAEGGRQPRPRGDPSCPDGTPADPRLDGMRRGNRGDKGRPLRPETRRRARQFPAGTARPERGRPTGLPRLADALGLPQGLGYYITTISTSNRLVP